MVDDAIRPAQLVHQAAAGRGYTDRKTGPHLKLRARHVRPGDRQLEPPAPIAWETKILQRRATRSPGQTYPRRAVVTPPHGTARDHARGVRGPCGAHLVDLRQGCLSTARGAMCAPRLNLSADLTDSPLDGGSALRRLVDRRHLVVRTADGRALACDRSRSRTRSRARRPPLRRGHRRVGGRTGRPDDPVHDRGNPGSARTRPQARAHVHRVRGLGQVSSGLPEFPRRRTDPVGRPACARHVLDLARAHRTARGAAGSAATPVVVGGALGLCSAIGNIVSDGDGNSDGAQLRRMRRTPVEEPYADPRAATSTAPPDTKPAA